MTTTLFELDHAVRYLRSWIKPQRKPTPLYLAGTDTHVSYLPKGPSLIISPWNYSILLTLGPVIHATAAGCPFVVKPSELTPHASRVLHDLVASVFPVEEGVVLEGGAELATSLLELPFSHIHFTGSARVGKLIMHASAEHLSSVTLELGGKSPTYVDQTADLTLAAHSICFGKFSNSGQTCIAPDYILVDESIHDALVNALRIEISNRYGVTVEERMGDNYARIVARSHYDRLVLWLDEAERKGARVEFGGNNNDEQLFVDPTILTNVPPDCALMKQEIFGPLLPIIPVKNAEEAITFIKNLPPPLSTYVFSKRNGVADLFSKQLRTGAVSVNTTLLQFVQPFGPFGGEGNSGIGRSHGEAGFKAFSNEQVVLRRKWGDWLLHMAFPPYTKKTTWFTRILQKLS